MLLASQWREKTGEKASELCCIKKIDEDLDLGLNRIQDYIGVATFATAEKEKWKEKRKGKVKKNE